MQQDTITLTMSLKIRLETELHSLRAARQHVQREEISDRRDVDEGLESTNNYSAHLVHGFLKRRIANLEALLDSAMIVADCLNTAGVADTAEMGSVVTLLDLASGEEWICTLANSMVADLLENGVSDQSPVGKALLNKRVGSVVEVAAPAGTVGYKIVAIR